MKNIHILPTNKPSYLYQIGGDLILSVVNTQHGDNVGRHIYMTSNDVKLVGDYIYDPLTKQVSKVTKETVITAGHHSYEKIILTTDQDLIADGIEPIDDEFIKFIVNNTKCEGIEWKPKHRIEKKVEELDVEETAKIKFDLFQKENHNIPKKDIQPFKLGFIMGARWQKEKSYGEKDIIDLIQFLSMNQSFNDYSSVSKETAKSFLEQFKKK